MTDLDSLRSLTEEFIRNLEELATQEPVDPRLTAALDVKMALSEVLVGLVGPLSAGKSTLVGALTGVHSLPVDVLPTTMVPTLLLPSDEETARAIDLDERPVDLSEAGGLALVADAARDGEFDRVEVEYIAGPAWPGLAFADFPGLGGAQAGQQGEGLRLLDRCDIVLYCLPATRLPTAADRAFFLAGLVPTDRMLLALTRADLVSPDELKRLSDYVRSSLGISPDRIAVVGGLNGDTGWGVEELAPLLRSVGAEVSVLAGLRGLLHILSEPVSGVPFTSRQVAEIATRVPGLVESSVISERSRLLSWLDTMLGRIETRMVENDSAMGSTSRVQESLNRELAQLDGNLNTMLEKARDAAYRRVAGALGDEAARELVAPDASLEFMSLVGSAATSSGLAALGGVGGGATIGILAGSGLAAGGGGMAAGTVLLGALAGPVGWAIAAATVVAKLRLGKRGMLGMRAKNRAWVRETLQGPIRNRLRETVHIACDQMRDQLETTFRQILDGLAEPQATSAELQQLIARTRAALDALESA